MMDLLLITRPNAFSDQTRTQFSGQLDGLQSKTGATAPPYCSSPVDEYDLNGNRHAFDHCKLTLG